MLKPGSGPGLWGVAAEGAVPGAERCPKNGRSAARFGGGPIAGGNVRERHARGCGGLADITSFSQNVDWLFQDAARKTEGTR